MEHSEIKGFTDQSDRNKALVNRNKELEELVLRQIDVLKNTANLDPRCIQLGYTGIQEAFMWLNRGIFQPQRIDLPTTDPRDPDPHQPIGEDLTNRPTAA